MSCQAKTSGQCQLREKKHQYFSIISLPTDSVTVDQAVYLLSSIDCCIVTSAQTRTGKKVCRGLNSEQYKTAN
jgi:hypothetical protein